MRTLRTATLALLLAGIGAGAVHAVTSVAAGIHIGPSGRASVDLGFFYDDLAPYGHWVQRPTYGWVFIPTVATGWRPYLQGHWVWTDDGWVWVSDEPFGWATYHYGRWYDDATYGWEWVPGDEWGPAWVDWQASSDYIGWAPLPPSYDWGRPARYNLAADNYVFVPDRFFMAARVSSYAVPVWESARIYPTTRDYTNYRAFNGTVFNQGVPVTVVQQAIGRPVARFRVADLPARQWRQGVHIARDQVQVFRPQVQRAAVTPLSRPIARRSVLTASEARTLATRHANRRQMEAQQQLRHQGQPARVAREMRQQDRLNRQAQQHGRPVREMRQQARKDQQLRQHGKPAREIRQMNRPSRQVQQHGRPVREVRQNARPKQQLRQHGKPAREVRQMNRPQRPVRQGRQMREMRQMNRPNRQVQRHAQAFRAPRQQARAQRQAGPQRQFRQQRQAGPQRQFRQQRQGGGPQRQARQQAQGGGRPGGGQRGPRHGHGQP